MSAFFRGRRLRQSAQMRALFQETGPFEKSRLIMPYFIYETDQADFAKEIPSMPGQYQFSIPSLLAHMERYVTLGLKNVLLFGIPAQKDERASQAYADTGIIQEAVRNIKGKFPRLIIITDVCLCEYMSHGHCGILQKDGSVLNDETLPLLAQTAVSYAKAGADVIAPSDMMDGRIGALRSALDENGFINTPIMSYAVKYASAFYGPFRDAAESAPACGDRKAYQMNPANKREALLEARADIEEGADALIIKPAGPYSDIIHLVSQNVDVPIAAYQVSGEYSMICAAAQNGWINKEAVVLESLLGIKRAGASMLITYFTEYLLERGLAVTA